MNTKLAALALVIVIALTALGIYALNGSVNIETSKPSSSPVPTPTSTPTVPTDQNTSVTDWAQRGASYSTQIIITSPQNASHQASSLTLSVNVTTSFWAISSVYYKADWIGDYHRIYSLNTSPIKGMSNAITLTANFTGIPSGNHTLELIANYHDSSHANANVSFTTG